MIVTCPSCDTKYRASEEALQARSGKVRCASCNHVWVVEEEALTLEKAVEPDPVASIDMESSPESGFGEATQPHAKIRQREEAKRRKARLMTEAVAWGGIAACFAVLMGGAWLFKGSVVELFPATSSAYAAMGAEINPYGLEVRELSVERREGEALPALVIEGEVFNVSGRSRSTLPLRAALLDGNGDVLVEWMVLLESPELPSQGRERFRTELPDPPEDARSVKVILSPDDVSDNVENVSVDEDTHLTQAPSDH